MFFCFHDLIIYGLSFELLIQNYNRTMGWQRVELPDLNLDSTGFLYVFLRTAFYTSNLLLIGFVDF